MRRFSLQIKRQENVPSKLKETDETTIKWNLKVLFYHFDKKKVKLTLRGRRKEIILQLGANYEFLSV